MAILIVEPENTVIDKSKQTNEQRQQQLHYHHHYYYTHQELRKDKNDDDDNDVDVGDFYHIKQCYQLTAESSTLNQRTKYPKMTAAVAAATATSTLSHILHSHAYNCRLFSTLMFMGYLLLIHSAMAAPQSCILCDKNDLQAKDPQTNYEEFLFEHQVTRQDAINALRQLNESFYEGTASDSSCNGVRCTEKVMKYCLGPQFINDHCWCEVGHSTEGLPFVPHICYVGEKIYKTSVGSCFFYEEVKDCCCSSVLAKEWRHISAGTSVYSKIWFYDCYVLATIFWLYLLIRRLFN